MTSPRRDLLGEWFAALEAHGENYTFRLGRYRLGMSQPDWFFLPHDRFDGLGGLAHVLRTRFNRDLELPQSGERRPSGGERFKAALRLLFRRFPRLMEWRDEDTAWRPGEARHSAPTALAWLLLSEEETRELRQQARQRRISFNAWLLWALAGATLAELRGQGSLEWIVPINMRGAVQLERDTANAAWTLDVAFAPGASPQNVHGALQREFERRSHWGGWQLMNLLRYFTPRVLREVARREMAVRKHGCFSNMGLVGPSALAERDAEWWMAFNPVLRSRPVGAACLTWGGRLALTLQLHPALTRSPERAKDWLDAWAERALGRRAQSPAKSPAAREFQVEQGAVRLATPS